MKLASTFALSALVCTVLACNHPDWIASSGTHSITDEDASELNPKQDAEKFPDAWVGTWEGELSVLKNLEVVQTVGAELTIALLDDGSGYEWTTRYLGDTKITKSYKLIAIDAEKGHYQIDEGPVQLDSYYANGTLRGWFQIGKTLIYSQYEMVGDKLVFELISGASNVDREGQDPETGGTVTSLPIDAFQRIELQRK